jgi:hypothetical protein
VPEFSLLSVASLPVGIALVASAASPSLRDFFQALLSGASMTALVGVALIALISSCRQSARFAFIATAPILSLCQAAALRSVGQSALRGAAGRNSLGKTRRTAELCSAVSEVQKEEVDSNKKTKTSTQKT